MADPPSLTAAALAVQEVLDARLLAEGQGGFNRQPRAFLVGADQFEKGHTGGELRTPALSVYVHRVEINRTMRPPWSAVSHVDGRAHVPLDLHLLVSAWGEHVQDELTLLGRAVLYLEESPILSGPALPATGGFAPGEAVQVVADDLGPDWYLRLFEALQAMPRPSMAYLARIVRVSSPVPVPDGDVGTLVAGIVPTTER